MAWMSLPPLLTFKLGMWHDSCLIALKQRVGPVHSRLADRRHQVTQGEKNSSGRHISISRDKVTCNAETSSASKSVFELDIF